MLLAGQAGRPNDASDPAMASAGQAGAAWSTPWPPLAASNAAPPDDGTFGARALDAASPEGQQRAHEHGTGSPQEAAAGDDETAAARFSGVRMRSAAADACDPLMDAPSFNTDHFRMTCYKVLACSRRSPHEWKTCPFVHPGEHGRRRPLSVVKYEAAMCPHARRNEPCPMGDSCTKAHNIFEMWLHPDRYRTQICIQGPACTCKVCFFAHTPEELRRPQRSMRTSAEPAGGFTGGLRGGPPSSFQSSSEPLSSGALPLLNASPSLSGSWPQLAAPLSPPLMFGAVGGSSGGGGAPAMVAAPSPFMYIPAAPPAPPALGATGAAAGYQTATLDGRTVVLIPQPDAAMCDSGGGGNGGGYGYASPAIPPITHHPAAGAAGAAALAGQMESLWVTQPLPASGYGGPPSGSLIGSASHFTAPTGSAAFAQAASAAVSTTAPLSAPLLGQGRPGGAQFGGLQGAGGHGAGFSIPRYGVPPPPQMAPRLGWS